VVGSALARVAPSDLFELTKPRITALVLMTVAAGYVLGAPAAPPPAVSMAVRGLVLAHLLVGTALVAGGTNALNQVLERDLDALMRRTAARPLPAGRLGLREAALFGWGTGALGVLYLAMFTNALTAIIAAATLASYVLVYTPLKRHTSLAMVIGAVPGALPIAGGWTASGASLSAEAVALFAILFVWQLPHFLALSWIYKEDYARAGFRMLAVEDPDGRSTFMHATLTAGALIPITLAPAVLGLGGMVYFVGGAVLASWMLWRSVAAVRDPSMRRARRVFTASLVYLPVVLALLIFDRVS
jgi:heme o synthase